METTAISTEKARSRSHERAFHNTAREDRRRASWGAAGGVRSGLSFSCIPNFCFINYRRFRRPARLPGPHFLLQQSAQNRQRHRPFLERPVIEAGNAEGRPVGLPVVVEELAPAAPEILDERLAFLVVGQAQKRSAFIVGDNVGHFLVQPGLVWTLQLLPQFPLSLIPILIGE